MALDLTSFLNRFVDEARDRLNQMLAALADLEREPGSQECLNAVFRAAHTIKGSARMLKLAAITETSHKLEDLLDALRGGGLPLTPERQRLLVRGADALALLVDRVAAGERAPTLDAVLIQELTHALLPDAITPPPAPEPPPAPDLRPRQADSVRIRLDKLDEVIKLMGEVLFSHARVQRRAQEAARMARQGADGEDWVRLTRALGEEVAGQGLVMAELGQKTLLMRMLPLAMLFDTAARLVREAARTLGKEVECVVKGGEIELDRRIIDRLSDPLVHLLRNAVDHGLESPEERLAAGKPTRGRIELTARQEGQGVAVVIRDDGRGLDQGRIIAKAVQRGLLDTHAPVTPQQLLELITQPGFSTSALITDLSGRGVGMDVVKRTIVDELQGEFELVTQPGAGTTFTLRLPLSLAIMRVLLCQGGGLTVGFTAHAIHELTRLTADKTRMLAGRRVMVLDNEFIPLLELAPLLGLPAGGARHRLGELVVVVKGHQEKLALLVDTLEDEQDMMIMPLPDHLRGLPLVSGMVITGANALVSILHVPALLERARALRGEAVAPGATAATARHILVVDDSLSTREIEKEVLESHGYRVTLAEDGLDGWQKAMTTPFDAILTDVEMPGLDGFALTARLRGEERYHHTPIIIVTSRETEGDKRRGIQAGADAYIVKGSFEQGSLLETLRHLLV